MNHSHPVYKPSVVLLQTNLIDRSINVSYTPNPQSSNPCTPTPLERLDPSLSLLAKPISL